MPPTSTNASVEEDPLDALLAELQAEYGAHLDGSLIAAIASECMPPSSALSERESGGSDSGGRSQGQGQDAMRAARQAAREILGVLAADAGGAAGGEAFGGEEQLGGQEGGARESESEAQEMAGGVKSQDHAAPPASASTGAAAPGAPRSRRQMAFSGKITTTTAAATDSSSSASSAAAAGGSESAPLTSTSTPSLAPTTAKATTSSASTSTSPANVNEREVEQMLAEWERREKQQAAFRASHSHSRSLSLSKGAAADADGGQEDGESGQPEEGERGKGQEEPQEQHDALLQLTDEEDSALPLPLLGEGDVPPSSSSSSSVQGRIDAAAPESESESDLDFLSHAFPSRAPAFLRSILHESCDGDVGMAVDTLAAIDLAESESEASGSLSTSSSTSASAPSSTQRQGQRGNRSVYDELDPSLSRKGREEEEDVLLMRGAQGAEWRGKKRKAARRRVYEAQRRHREGLPPLPLQLQDGGAAGLLAPRSAGPSIPAGGFQQERAATTATATKEQTSKVKINLTDVRHGASVVEPRFQAKAVPRSAAAAAAAPPEGTEVAGKDESDEAFARRLAEADEQRSASYAGFGRAAGGGGLEGEEEGSAAAAVRDNKWLLASSVLSQLSELLALEEASVKSAYAAAGFNLPVTFNRLVASSASASASLQEAQEGEREAIRGIAELTVCPLALARQCFRAAQGRHADAIDLVQLRKLLWSTAEPDQLPDELDQLHLLDDDDGAAAKESTAAASTEAAAARKPDAYPRLEDTPFIATTATRGPTSATASSAGGSTAPWRGSSAGYAGIASAFPSPAQQARATQAARLAAQSTVLPASSARLQQEQWSTVGPKKRTNEYDYAFGSSGGGRLLPVGAASASAADCRLMAEEYRERRARVLQQAAAAWRSSNGGAAKRAGGAGGAAWYYADEARRLDAKARAWEMRAAQSLVEERRAAKVGYLRRRTNGSSGAAGGSSAAHGGTGGGGGASGGTMHGDEIDLHGLTVYEALSVSRNCVNEWYAQSDAGTLKIITGVGKHSRNQVALIKPAVAKMLDRDGWKYDVDNYHGIITVRGVK